MLFYYIAMFVYEPEASFKLCFANVISLLTNWTFRSRAPSSCVKIVIRRFQYFSKFASLSQNTTTNGYFATYQSFCAQLAHIAKSVHATTTKSTNINKFWNVNNPKNFIASSFVRRAPDTSLSFVFFCVDKEVVVWCVVVEAGCMVSSESFPTDG